MSSPAFIDLEASGFGRGSYPIEVGFVDGAGQPFCTLIHPEPDWVHWDDQAEAVHGISRAVLATHGRSAEWVAAALNERLAGQTVYCDGWAQDYPWLARLYDAVDLTPSFRLEDLRTLLDEAQAARWHATVDRVRDELSLGRHRASSDAKVLQIAVQRVRAGSA